MENTKNLEMGLNKILTKKNLTFYFHTAKDFLKFL